EGLLQWRRLVVNVRLVEVDVVRLEAAERLLDRAKDVGPGEPLVGGAPFDPDLGGEDGLVALAACFVPVAEDGLGLAALVARRPARVDVRCVDQVEARIDAGVEQAERGRLVGGPAENVAAEGQRPDLYPRVSELARCHVPSPPGARAGFA